MKDKVILTDCDEVLLRWSECFEEWMLQRGYEVVAPESYNARVRLGLNEQGLVNEILEFNHSEAFAHLRTVDKSVEYVNKLHNEGFQFVIITSCTVNPISKRYRKQNLFREFAINNSSAFEDRMFISVVCLPCGSEKNTALNEFRYTYPGCYWIEDNIYNAEVGMSLGFDSILIEQKHNKHYTGPVKHLRDWQAIYDHIMSEQR